MTENLLLLVLLDGLALLLFKEALLGFIDRFGMARLGNWFSELSFCLHIGRVSAER